MITMTEEKKKKESTEDKLLWEIKAGKMPPTRARKGKVKEQYQKIIDAISAKILSGEGTEFLVVVKGKTAKQLYSPLIARVDEFNKNPNRKFDLELHTIKPKEAKESEAWIVRVDKGTSQTKRKSRKSKGKGYVEI